MSGHKNRQPLKAAVIVCICVVLHRVVVFDGGNAVEQRRHEICLGVIHTGPVLRNAIHDLLDVQGVDFSETLLDKVAGILGIPAYPNRGTSVECHFQHDLDQFIKLIPAISLDHDLILNLRSDVSRGYSSFCPSAVTSFFRRRKE